MLRESDLSSKLAQVIEQIPKDVLYDFCCSYAQEHEELAMALVSEFWRPEKDDYRSMVQQCLMHPTLAGVKNGDGYDHFAGWIRRLYNSSSECEKIAREVAEEILKENPNKGFGRMFERIGVM